MASDLYVIFLSKDLFQYICFFFFLQDKWRSSRVTWFSFLQENKMSERIQKRGRIWKRMSNRHSNELGYCLSLKDVV